MTNPNQNQTTFAKSEPLLENQVNQFVPQTEQQSEELLRHKRRVFRLVIGGVVMLLLIIVSLTLLRVLFPPALDITPSELPPVPSAVPSSSSRLLQQLEFTQQVVTDARPSQHQLATPPIDWEFRLE